MFRNNNNSFASIETLETRTFLSASLHETAMLGHGLTLNAVHVEQTVGATKAAARHVAPAKAKKAAPVKKVTPAPAKKAVPAKKAAPARKATPAPVKPVTPVAPVSPAATVLPDQPEPIVTDANLHYQTFSNNPLFSAAGPSENDIHQGAVGDCWLLSTLSSVAKVDPASIRRDIVAVGDGTYNVQIVHNGTTMTVRVDGQLPVTAAGTPAYAALGAGGSLWVAIFEKAYAVVRNGSDSYASLNSGWMNEAYSALGDQNSTFGASSPASLLSNISGALSAGKSVTIGFGQVTDGSGLVGEHAYTVDSIGLDASGNPATLRLRNPWGTGGAANDGYVTVTAQQASNSALGFTIASV